MAFLKGNSKRIKQPASVTNSQLLCIPEGSLFAGDINATNDVRIDGELNGNLTTTGILIVGASCTIKGDVRAGDVSIAGRVLGNLTSTGDVSICSSGTLKGNVCANGFIAERGSQYSGHCEIGVTDEVVKFPTTNTDKVEQKRAK